MDAVLIVGAGPLQVPMIQEAQALGLAAIVTDANPDAPGAAMADAFYPIDTYDVPGHRTLGHMLVDQGFYTIRGVVTCGGDVAPSVAAAAGMLGCRCLPLDVAQRTHNKFQVRRTLSEAGLDRYQPRCSHVECTNYDQWVQGSLFTDERERWEQIQQAYQIPLPWVVKPLEERASRGVSIVTNYTEYKAAIDKVSVFGTAYLVEERLMGTEHSAELILGGDGSVLWFNIVDRYFDYSSGIPLEVGHVNPTCLGEHAQQQILLMALSTAKALGVTWGPFKIDCMMTTTGPKILECTARLSGGWDSQYSSPATDRHPMKLLLQLACGLSLDAQPQMAGADGYAAVAAIMPSQYGTIMELPCTPHVIWAVKPGATSAPLEHNAQRCGYAMAHRRTYDDAWTQAQTLAAVAATQMSILPPPTNQP